MAISMVLKTIHSLHNQRILQMMNQVSLAKNLHFHRVWMTTVLSQMHGLKVLRNFLFLGKAIRVLIPSLPKLVIIAVKKQRRKRIRRLKSWLRQHRIAQIPFQHLQAHPLLLLIHLRPLRRPYPPNLITRMLPLLWLLKTGHSPLKIMLVDVLVDV